MLLNCAPLPAKSTVFENLIAVSRTFKKIMSQSTSTDPVTDPNASEQQAEEANALKSISPVRILIAAAAGLAVVVYMFIKDFNLEEFSKIEFNSHVSFLRHKIAAALQISHDCFVHGYCRYLLFSIGSVGLFSSFWAHYDPARVF